MSSRVFVGYAAAAYRLLHYGNLGLRKSSVLPINGQSIDAIRAQNASRQLALPDDACLDICVLADLDRRKSLLCHPHVCRFAEEGDFMRFRDDIYIARPELVFLQMANALSVCELILLGYELCGTFATQDSIFSRTNPLTTKQRLEDFVKQRAGERGTKKAREALRYVIDGSASPREIQLAALLCTSQKHGGYGFPLPALNGKIDLDAHQQRVLGRRFLRCDILWRQANLAIEYDSDAFHCGAEKINDDSLRRNILRRTGITVIDVTNAQLRKAEAFHEIAIQVENALGITLIGRRPHAWNARNQSFRRLLFCERALDRLR